MRNIKVKVAYEGTDYSGWQIQKNTAYTIQQILQEKLTEISRNKVQVIGAGRTDAGVHAWGQVANFQIDSTIPTARIPQALNSMLPAAIVCKQAKEVEQSFHARYDAKAKKYLYRIHNYFHPPVFNRKYVYHLYQSLDVSLMRDGAKHLIGRHDFVSFQASNSYPTDTVRKIKSVKVFKQGREIGIEVIGDGFLYKMIRIITGTLIEIGLGKKKPSDVQEIIKAKTRAKAGFTAPAQGLTLIKVYY